MDWTSEEFNHLFPISPLTPLDIEPICSMHHGSQGTIHLEYILEFVLKEDNKPDPIQLE